MKFFRLVWSNLGRKKIRTALTLMSIFVAFLLFGYLCAIKEAFLVGVELAGRDRIVVRHKVSLIQPLPLSYERRIASIPGIDAVAAQSWFGGIYQEPKNFFASIAVEPESFLDMFREFILPEEQKQMWLKTRNGAVIGRLLATRFNWKIGDHVPLTSPIWGEPEGQSHWDFEVVGIYDGAKEGTDTNGMFFRYDYFDEARPRGKGQVGWFTVRIKNPDEAADLAKRVDDEFANSPFETKAEPEGAFAAGFANQFGDIRTIMMGVVSAVFFTILLVAGNTMAQAVRERTEELGVLKAMGFTSELILALVLMESLMIAAVGGLAGLGFAALLLSFGSPAPQVLPILYFPARDLLLGLGFVAALGICAGVIPAVQAMRLRIAEALRRNA